MAKLHGITVRPQSVKHLRRSGQEFDVLRHIGVGGLGRFGGNPVLRNLFRGPGGFGGISFGSGNIFRVTTRYFFDRAAVQHGVNRMLWQALARASYRVRMRAINSIQRVGRARPPLRIMQTNQGVALQQLLGMTNNRRTQAAIITRIAEIQMGRGLSSPPGQPPYTHVPHSVMVGFRRNLYNAYDPSTHSGVAGPERRGRQWDLPALHELGGVLRMRRWVWVPPYRPRPGYVPLVQWHREGFPPRQPRRGHWAPMMILRRFPYPARPFMSRAMHECIRRGEIQAAFANTFTTRVTA